MFAGFWISVILLYNSAIPGSETKLKVGTVELSLKTPSSFDRFRGEKDQSFKAKNDDEKEPAKIIFSASSMEVNLT